MLHGLIAVLLVQANASLIARDKLVEIAIGTATSTVGFFCALFINSYLEFCREKKGYRAILESIRQEAESNRAVLEQSFAEYYRKGLVLRDLSVSGVRQGIAMPMFTKNARGSEARVINRYLRNIMLCNAYRQKAEQFRTDGKGQVWLAGLIENWGKNINDCFVSTDEVLKLGSTNGTAALH